MKRFLTATAVTALIATGASAATQSEIDTIKSYVPEANVEAMSNAKVASLMNIVSSTDSRSEIVSKLQGLISEDDTVAFTPSEGQISELRTFAPGVDFSGFTDAQLAQAINIMNAGEGDAVEKIAALQYEDEMVTTDPLTQAEMDQLQEYAPAIDFSRFTDAELLQARAIVNSASSRSDALAQLKSFEVD